MVPNDNPMKWELVALTLALKQLAGFKILSVSIVSSL
jgi:hypothetical protein